MANLSELDKQRDIFFSPLHENQVERARQFLSDLPDCGVKQGDAQNSLIISYNLHQHTLKKLEGLLVENDFHLDHSVLRNIERNVIHYCEDTICHNMDVPVHPTKKNEREVFIKAYELELHGDLDDSPPEIRDFK
jgi:hypothetical protein